MEACKAWLACPDGRFARFLKAVEASKKDEPAACSGGPFLLGGSSPSYVDFLLLNAKLTMDFMFGTELVDACFAAGGSGVVEAVAATAARPNVKAFLATAEPVVYASVEGMPK